MTEVKHRMVVVVSTMVHHGIEELIEKDGGLIESPVMIRNGVNDGELMRRERMHLRSAQPRYPKPPSVLLYELPNGKSGLVLSKSAIVKELANSGIYMPLGTVGTELWRLKQEGKVERTTEGWRVKKTEPG